MLECDAKFVAFPAHDGEMGILCKRAPLVCKLGTGPLRVEGADAKHLLFIDGGFAQMLGDELTILTSQARPAAELDAAAAQRALQEAQSRTTRDEIAAAARARDVERARRQLRLARRVGK